MTIAQAFNEIAVAQGGTASTSGTIAGAIDALNDALAGSDQQAAQTIEDAVRLLGQNIGGGSSVTVESLTATENKTYTAPEGKAYSPVTVNVSGGVSSYSIYCMVNDESAPSIVYPAKATNEGNWEQDGNSALDEAYAGQMLYIPSGFIISLASYFDDPFPDYPAKIPYSNTIADNSGCVFTMPAHDIGIMAYVENPI